MIHSMPTAAKAAPLAGTTADTPMLPLVIESPSGECRLADFIAERRDTLRTGLTAVGALLFRGFGVTQASQFKEAGERLTGDALPYTERSSPRHAVADRVYTSTDHPADQEIVLHSEQSYTYDWPRYISFFCETRAAAGGNTPIADNRGILRRMPPALVEKFERGGILYRRTYGLGLGVDWRTAFQTDDKGTVEDFCGERDIDWTWDGDVLRTRQYRSAFQNHPETGERLWFNHALFFHISSLGDDLAEDLMAVVGPDDLPTNTCFGNGELFSAGEIQALRAAVAAEKCSFDWCDGDVLVLDNMRCQHGREPFSGARRVLTLMTMPYQSVAKPEKAPGRAFANASC